MTLGSERVQSMRFLGPAVARFFVASKVEHMGPLRHVRLTGCPLSARQVLARCLDGVPAQRPLNEGEAPVVAIFNVGTATCSAQTPRFPLPSTCPDCRRSVGDWVFRPCGHAVCGGCVLKTQTCAVCGNRDINTPVADTVDCPKADKVVEYLAPFCKGPELETVLSMLTATASFSLGPTQLSGAEEVEIISDAVANAEKLVIVQLISAVRNDVLGLGHWWHRIMSCIVRLFCNVGTFKGRPVTRENVCTALCFWKNFHFARKLRAVVTIQAYTRGWMARRTDPRATKRNGAAAKIQGLWGRFSPNRECVYCYEKGAQCTQCYCRGAQGRACEACVVQSFAASGKTDNCCLICKGRFTGKFGIRIASEIILRGLNPDPDKCLNLAEALIEEGSKPNINAAYQLLDDLISNLSRIDPHRVGGYVAHQGFVVRAVIQLALAESRERKNESAARRLTATMKSGCSGLGLDHPLSLKTQLHLAGIYCKMGQFQKSHDLLGPLLPQMVEAFGATSAEVLHGRMIFAASALDCVERPVLLRAIWSFWKTFETLRKHCGPAHPRTLAWIKWRKTQRLGYDTSGDIEYLCAIKIQALWRGWAQRRRCFVCKRMGASNMCCGCTGRWAHPECAANYEKDPGRCVWCNEFYTGEFGLGVLTAITEQKTAPHDNCDLAWALAMAKCRAPYAERRDPRTVLNKICATSPDARRVVWGQIVYGFVELNEGKLESAELRLAAAKNGASTIATRPYETRTWWYRSMAYAGACCISNGAWAEAVVLLTRALEHWRRNDACCEFTLFYGSVPLAYAKWKLGGAKAGFLAALGELRNHFGGGHDFVIEWLRKLKKPV